MIRILFAGDLTADPIRRQRATELMAQCAQYGFEALDATEKLLVRIGVNPTTMKDSGWRVAETARRLAQWSGAHPDLIVGFDPLHGALALRAFPATPVVLHVDSLSAGLPEIALHEARQVQGLHDLLGTILRGAVAVLVSNPRHVDVLRHTFAVDVTRVHAATLAVDDAAPRYLEAVQVGGLPARLRTPARTIGAFAARAYVSSRCA